MTRRAARLLVTAIAALLVAPACAGVAALQADQLSIVTPSELTQVQTPINIEWKAHDLPSSVARYAVFVDREPMSPGDDIRSVVDDGCRQRRGCPDALYLRNLGIYLTSDRSVLIPAMPIAGGINAQTARPVHQAIVVALDEQGRRVGEFSAIARFRYER